MIKNENEKSWIKVNWSTTLITLNGKKQHKLYTDIKTKEVCELNASSFIGILRIEVLEQIPKCRRNLTPF